MLTFFLSYAKLMKKQHVNILQNCFCVVRKEGKGWECFDWSQSMAGCGGVVKRMRKCAGTNIHTLGMY